MGVLSKNRADLARAGDCRANRQSSGAAIEAKQQWTAIRRRPNRVGLPGKSADRVCGHYARGLPEAYCEHRVAWEGNYPDQVRLNRPGFSGGLTRCVSVLQTGPKTQVSTGVSIILGL